MDDERYLVIDGRRWRRTDPAIPDKLRAELVAELMDARRAVGAALRNKDRDAEAAARARVGDAKVALGERGAPWWEERTAEGWPSGRRPLRAPCSATASRRRSARRTWPASSGAPLGARR